MPALTTNELTDLLNEEAVARAEARTLANISRRAQTLFTDGGYTALSLETGNYAVTSPKGDVYAVFASDVPAGEIFGSYCTCPCFVTRQTCKHLLGVELLMQDEADAANLDAAADAADYDRYAYRY